MAIFETIRVALAGLAANRLRAALTMLGIVIGVGAVIALMSFGQGVERYVKQKFQSLGSNLLFAFPVIPQGSNVIDAKPMTMADVDAIANPLYAPSVVRAAPEYALFAAVVAGRNDTAMSISGVTPTFQDVRAWYPSEGRFLDEADLNT